MNNRSVTMLIGDTSEHRAASGIVCRYQVRVSAVPLPVHAQSFRGGEEA